MKNKQKNSKGYYIDLGPFLYTGNGAYKNHIEQIKNHYTLDMRRLNNILYRTINEWEIIFNSISDTVTIHDKDYNIIFANKAAQKMLSLPDSKNNSRKKCYTYYHGRTQPPEGCPSCKCLQDGIPRNFELYEPYLKKFIKIRVLPRKDKNAIISGVIHIVKDITNRKKMENQLNESERELYTRAQNLKEVNTALKVLLKQRDHDKYKLERRFLANVKNLVLPYLEKLKILNTQPDTLNYLEIIESNIYKIIEPFSDKLSSDSFFLTPKEIQIANLVKNGKQTKEIAETLHLSIETINCHRQNIREKLKLKNKKVNLRSFLQTF